MTQPHDLLHGVAKGPQSTFQIADGKIIWIDPFRIGDGDHPKADIVFITHAHGDHLSGSDLRKVIKPETIAVGPPDCVSQVPVPDDKRIVVAPGETHTIAGITVEVVPAYNLTRQGHPRGNNWVGYVLNLDGRRVYHAGDTDRIPEMKDIRADVVMVPVGGTYTMDAAEAAAAVNEDLKPSVAVPMHYTVVGSEADAELFAQLVTVGIGQVMPHTL